MKKDSQTVTPAGERIAPLIHGMVIRPLTTLEDARGEIIEFYRPEWGVHPDPLVYGTGVRPSAIKGWIMHRQQEDRIAIFNGIMHWAFFDYREDSPTCKMLTQYTFSEKTRTLFTIPRGVFHAVKNVGTRDAYFVNMPSRAYQHADPDKYRLPICNDIIPFDFSGIHVG
ncbi:MAG: dTDP-4-dehydrorhamnose 3,5-epimerase family protein [Verrucomicrobiota bacterium]|nr:dTDP-4-dehydrorhamnose 3,5-epimerase family protein [Verrucomicrobiota bacterium]